MFVDLDLQIITSLRARHNLNASSQYDSLPEYPSSEEDDSPIKGDKMLARGDDAGETTSRWGLGGFINKLTDMVNTSLYW